MDKLHREHAFVTRMWNYMKTCESAPARDDKFWQWAQNEAERIAHDFNNLSFASDWLISYMKFLDK